MTSYESSSYPHSDHSPGSRIRRLLFALTSAAFIAGGLVFGFVFVARLETAMGITGQRLLGVPISSRIPRSFGLPDLSVLTPPIQILPVAENPPDWEGKERVNMLLLGVDQRPDEKGQPTRTDTMMIASLDPVNMTGALVSIPRDLWVPIPLDPRRPLEDKITTAHFYGDYFHYPGGGVALARKTVEYNFGIRIHFFAKVDFDGFEQAVDTLGGVTLCVERPLIDNEYPTRDYGYMRVFIPAGLQLLDGEHALQYVRSRHQDSDFGRTRRQQQVLLALREQAMRLEVIPKIPQLYQQFASSIESDLSISELIMLARLGSQIESQNISNRTIEGNAVREFRTAGGADALLPIRSEIQKIVSQTLYDPRTREPGTQDTTSAGTPDSESAGAGATPVSKPAQPAPSPTPAGRPSC